MILKYDFPITPFHQYYYELSLNMNLKYNSSILLHELSQNMNLKYNSSFDVNNKLFCQASIPTSRDQYLNMPSHKTKDITAPTLHSDASIFKARIVHKPWSSLAFSYAPRLSRNCDLG